VTQSTPPQDVVVRMAPENTVRLLAVASRDPKRDFQQDTSFGTALILPPMSVAGDFSPPVNKIPPEVTNFSISIGGPTSQSGRDPLGPVDPAPNNPHASQKKVPKMGWIQKIQKAVKHFIKN
jgi:hypothetical protein